MNDNDRYILRAFEIAFTKYGLTSPNPAVGAVIVRDGRIIGEGGTGSYGSDHAEVSAIRDALAGGNDTSGAEIFVTLEPCNHYGKTPPCTKAIIESGIKKVHIPVLDPNPVVSGNGVRGLIDAGIEVNIMHKHSLTASDMIRSFKKFILRGKPYVINKCAVTLDGRIATAAGDSKWISNDFSRLLVHKLRAKVDAVIVGANTVAMDNPMLNVRMDDFSDEIHGGLSAMSGLIAGRGNFFLAELLKSEITDYRDPLRVLIGIPEDISVDCNFFRDNNYIIIADTADFEKAQKSNDELNKAVAGLNIVTESFGSHEDCVDFALDILKGKGVMTALLEGGGTLNGAFFNAGEIDQFMYVIAPKVTGNGISPINGRGSDRMSDALSLRDVSTVMLGDNLLVSGFKEFYNFEMM